MRRPQRDVSDIDPHLNQPVDRATGRFHCCGDIVQRLLRLLLERRVDKFYAIARDRQLTGNKYKTIGLHGVAPGAAIVSGLVRTMSLAMTALLIFVSRK